MKAKNALVRAWACSHETSLTCLSSNRHLKQIKTDLGIGKEKHLSVIGNSAHLSPHFLIPVTAESTTYLDTCLCMKHSNYIAWMLKCLNVETFGCANSSQVMELNGWSSRAS